MSFNAITFGYQSAENEYAECPELLTHGFYDYGGWTQEILTGNKFLILGNKGVGKSALIQRIIIDKKYDRFYSLNNLEDFPFSTFCSALINNNTGKETVLPSSWEWLIIVQLIWLLQQDNKKEKDNKFDQYVNLLNKLGINSTNNIDNTWTQTLHNKSVIHGPSIELNQLIGIEASATTFKIEKESYNIESISDFQKLINYGKQIVFNQKTENHHYLFFDGLDRAIFAGTNAYESIAVLIAQCKKFNLSFRDNNLPLKIIIACRTDLFDKLPLINANAIRQTYAIQLEWRKDKRAFLNSELCQLVNYRAGMFLSREVSVFTEYFPEIILIGNKSWLSYIFILFHTRCTPRDILATLKAIQESHESSDEKVSLEEIIVGLTIYSNNYFKNEIIDEINGYTLPGEVEQIFNVLISLSTYRFEIDVFLRRSKEIGLPQERAIFILRLLFDCGAISNNFMAGDREQRPISVLYTPHAKLDTSKTIIVHRGLWKALNYV